jgi:hypothetical protein
MCQLEIYNDGSMGGMGMGMGMGSERMKEPKKLMIE